MYLFNMQQSNQTTWPISQPYVLVWFFLLVIAEDFQIGIISFSKNHWITTSFKAWIVKSPSYASELQLIKSVIRSVVKYKRQLLLLPKKDFEMIGESVELFFGIEILILKREQKSYGTPSVLLRSLEALACKDWICEILLVF